MADIPLAALTVNMGFTQGFPLQQKVVPKNIDGTIHDCTGITGLALTLAPSVPLIDFNETINPVVVSADATGIVLKVVKSDVDGIFTALGTNSGVLSATITDGTDTGNAFVGTWNNTPTIAV